MNFKGLKFSWFYIIIGLCQILCISLYYCTLTNCFFSPDKLAPEGPAMAKYRKAKRFDPTKSDVLQVLNEQEKGEYCVDKKAVIEARLDQQCNGVS